MAYLFHIYFTFISHFSHMFTFSTAPPAPSWPGPSPGPGAGLGPGRAGAWAGLGPSPGRDLARPGLGPGPGLALAPSPAQPGPSHPSLASLQVNTNWTKSQLPIQCTAPGWSGESVGVWVEGWGHGLMWVGSLGIRNWCLIFRI